EQLMPAYGTLENKLTLHERPLIEQSGHNQQ
ncbi:MAG: hypothetical protein ACI9N9_002486, partial [Enterobacterales bacterium]